MHCVMITPWIKTTLQQLFHNLNLGAMKCYKHEQQKSYNETLTSLLKGKTKNELMTDVYK